VTCEQVHIGEHSRGFDFKRLLDFFVVGFRIFSGAIFEAKIAEIFVDGVAALKQLIELGAMGHGIRRLDADAEDEDQSGDGEQGAGDGDVEATHGYPRLLSGATFTRAPIGALDRFSPELLIRDSALVMRRRLVIEVTFFATRAGEQFRRNGRTRGYGEGGAMAPAPHDEPNDHERDDRQREGHDPREQVEAGLGRLDENRGAIFLDEILEDEIVGFAAADALIDFLEHGLGGIAGTGESAAAVITATDRVVAAAAHAFEVRADGFDVRRVLRLRSRW
jgi:hypothetical protein